MLRRMNSKNQTAVGVIVTLLGVFWGTLIFYTLHASLPHNPVRLPYENKTAIRMVIPEGWAFFTKSPRDPNHLLFVMDRGQWKSAALSPVAKPSNAFGLNRAVRAQGVEFGLLTQQIGESAWSDCEEDPLRCLSRMDSALHLENVSPGPTLCGTVGIAMREQLPWAWRKSSHVIEMPSMVLKAKVSCDEMDG